MGWAALAKIGDPVVFAGQIHNFRILPLSGENLVAMVLPWIELTAALALLLGIRARAGAVLTTVLLAVFTVAVISALARGLNVECGCFGTSGGSRVGMAKVLQNLVLLGVAFVASLRPRSSTQTSTLVARPELSRQT
jgi:uncharacterized membrane protein YphA (DoxX/SURF4 family)